MHTKHVTRFRTPLMLAAALTFAAAAPVHVTAQQSTESGLPEALSSAFRDAAGRALPSVVFVSVERSAEDAMAFLPESHRQFLPEGPIQTGSGSGFVIDEDGLVMTNHHVVAEAEAIRVRMHDGHEYTAEVVASDPNTDVAVLRVHVPEGRTLPVAETGASHEVRVGDWVLALGNPLGLDFTVTAGIVSAVGRQISQRGGASLEAYIQTDAAINPGNSGGPLIDLRGRVIGMNTAISGSRFIGYGFAVPIEMARRVADDLIEHGYVRRPMLGVGIQDVTEVDAEIYGLADIAGAEVIRVEAGSPAEDAGLRAGDVITRLDGAPLRDATALTARLALYQPDDQVSLTVVRDREPRSVTVRLGEFPNEPLPQPVAGTPAEEAHPLGFTPGTVTPPIARELESSARDERFRAPVGAVYLADVERNSAAWLAGLRPGQVVLSVNGRSVEELGDVESLLAGFDAGDAVSVRVLDRGLGEMIANFRVR